MQLPNFPSRYYFDFSDGEEGYFIDDIGLLFPDIHSAKQAATEALSAHAAEAFPAEVVNEVSVRIRQGKDILAVATITLSFV